jgi:pimeloyl-ACP methyl ester carboxylesterase
MESPTSAPPIVLIHGLWLTSRSWEGWKERFESRGYRVLAPPWPRIEGEVENIRRDPSPLNGLGLEEIVEHYVNVVRDLDRPPIIIGHSFGGLVTELLLDRGFGAVGVALSPAPVKGVLRLPLAQLRSAFPALKNPAGRNKTTELTPQQFHYAFTNTMSADDSKAAYDRYAVPGPNRPLFQAAFRTSTPTRPARSISARATVPRCWWLATAPTTPCPRL